MKKGKIVLASALAGLVLAAVVALRGSGQQESAGFAVVELYTSEGCSSCPPAEALMERTQQADRDLPVYCLAFHVDYWDRLGWKDVFSSAVYTDRQRQYARWLKASQLYTPQAVVNGTTEFVGSDEAALTKAIRAGLQQKSAVTLTLSGLKLDAGKVDWQYRIAGLSGTGNRRLSLVAVVVEKQAVTQVKDGENSGRTLRHVQIVRSLGMQTPDTRWAGSGHLDWPPGLPAAQGELVAFLQDEDTGKIISVTRATV
ncbi:MAG TPA: DUF1223 domain-containing protein [Puia sp.]|nr:DUF1223 domain-containing protein [Puia sp.]